MTIAEAWDVLDAADQVARAHGWTCYPLITRRVLRVELHRGQRFTAGYDCRVVLLTEERLNACADAAAVRELVEREVAKALAGKVSA